MLERFVACGWYREQREEMKSLVNLLVSHIATMEADPTKTYNQDDAARLDPAECVAIESRGQGAET